MAADLGGVTYGKSKYVGAVTYGKVSDKLHTY
jgi:hypothetical protein